MENKDHERSEDPITSITYRLVKPQLILHGPGDRGIGSGGPASFPGEEPLLPRLETLIGSLGIALASSSSPDIFELSRPKDYNEYLEKITEMLLGTNTNILYYGPFLHVKTIGNEDAVYIDIGTGLLKLLEKRNGSVSIANTYREYCRAAIDLISSAIKPVENPCKGISLTTPLKMTRIGRYIPKNETAYTLPDYISRDNILQYNTKIGLNRRTKTAKERMIYTEPVIDYQLITGGEHAEYEIIVLARHTSGSPQVQSLPGALSIKQRPIIINIKHHGGRIADDLLSMLNSLIPSELEPSKYYTVISPLTINLPTKNTNITIYTHHPIQGKTRYMRMGRTFTSGKLFEEFKKDNPLIALSPGTIIFNVHMGLLTTKYLLPVINAHP
ncbi:MAG: hypothetical protein GXO26_02585 [Crenarchaeota archaeon]|nr:hypothetical protein [Thermoproteota archaeon]